MKLKTIFLKIKTISILRHKNKKTKNRCKMARDFKKGTQKEEVK